MNGRKQLKSTLKNKRQEITKLKKLVRLNNENYQTVLDQYKKTNEATLNEYHNLVRNLQLEHLQTLALLTEARRKKWYQFRKIE